MIMYVGALSRVIIMSLMLVVASTFGCQSEAPLFDGEPIIAAAIESSQGYLRVLVTSEQGFVYESRDLMLNAVQELRMNGASKKAVDQQLAIACVHYPLISSTSWSTGDIHALAKTIGGDLAESDKALRSAYNESRSMDITDRKKVLEMVERITELTQECKEAFMSFMLSLTFSLGECIENAKEITISSPQE